MIRAAAEADRNALRRTCPRAKRASRAARGAPPSRPARSLLPRSSEPARGARRTPGERAMPTIIKDGYGEFVIVKRRFNENQPLPLTYEEYESIYRVTLHMSSPLKAVSVYRARIAAGTGSIDAREEQAAQAVQRLCATRARTMQLDLDGRNAQRRGEEYAFVFIPRTLYELFYLNKIMEQERDLASLTVWPVKPMAQYEAAIVDPDVDLDAENIGLSFLMNNLIVSKLQAILPVNQKPSFPLTDTQIAALGAPELRDFAAHVNNRNARRSGFIYTNPGHVQSTISLGARLSGSETARTRVAALAKAMAKAIQIEIDPATIGNLLLYRGSDYDLDSIVGSGGFPISYNTGFWATLVYDPDFATSTPIFMLEGHRNGHCLTIPWQALLYRKFPFHVPLTNALKQLHGHDQPSHAWTKSTDSFFTTNYGVDVDTLPATNQLHYMKYYVNDRNALNNEFQTYASVKRIFYKWDIP
jgi:hypothetical protein